MTVLLGKAGIHIMMDRTLIVMVSVMQVMNIQIVQKTIMIVLVNAVDLQLKMNVAYVVVMVLLMVHVTVMVIQKTVQVSVVVQQNLMNVKYVVAMVLVAVKHLLIFYMIVMKILQASNLMLVAQV